MVVLCDLEDLRHDPEATVSVIEKYRAMYPNNVIKIEMRQYRRTLVRRTIETDAERDSRNELIKRQGLRNLGLF